jgi:quercetin dioxygenase-like cupin family protein
MANSTGTQSSNGPPVYNLNDIPSREMRRGIIQRVFRGDQVAIGYNQLHPGMATNPHSHDFEQIFILLEGRVKLHVGDDVHQCEAGSIVRIPPHTEHWAEPPLPEDGVALNMDIFSPIREDYYALTDYQTDKFGQ